MTLSRLRLGEPMLRAGMPPRREASCVDPLLIGSNILRDPGFEYHTARVPAEPITGMLFPEAGGYYQALPSTHLQWPTFFHDSILYETVDICGSLTGWGVNSSDEVPTGGSVWDISTTNPRGGTDHARMDWTGGTKDEYPTPLMAVAGCKCGATWPYSARVEPGYTVTWSAYFYFTEPGAATLDMKAWTYLEWFNESGDDRLPAWDGGGPPSFSTGTADYTLDIITAGSYQAVSVSAIAPADSYWVNAWMGYDVNSFTPAIGTYVLDIDDCSLGVA